MKSLQEILGNYIQACFSGLWIETREPDEAVREIRELGKNHEWKIGVWDIDNGLTSEGLKIATTDPVETIKNWGSQTDQETPKLLILRNLHRFLKTADIIQVLENQIQKGKSTRTYFIVLAPTTDIPLELQKLFTVLEHPLPSREQLRQLAEEINGSPINKQKITAIAEAAAGMTRYEAENSFSLSLIEHDEIKPESIWAMKAKILKGSSALSLYRGEIPTLGGMESMTNFCRRILTKRNGRERAKGVMLLGVSGSGKSAFCKMLGSLSQRPTLILDVSALMGSLVGQTEAALRQALRTIDQMNSCIVMIDEVEKCLSVGGNDGGVSARMFGTLLTWLNDREGDSFVVCTANDISKLPPEFTRAERFDAIFFVDLPDDQAKAQIWSIYEREYELGEQAHPDDTNWTGAEIKACCRLARLLEMPLKEAAVNIVPVASTAAESIHSLRQWASRRCLDANKPGMYLFDESDMSRSRPIRKKGNDEPPAAVLV